MATNQEIKQQQRTQAIEQEQLIGYWAKRKYGVYAREFLNHPYWNDIRLLLAFRHEFEATWTQSEHGTWARYWEYVANKNCRLKGKHLRKLEALTLSILARKQIQATRQNPKKEDQDNDGKGSSATYNIPWE